MPELTRRPVDLARHALIVGNGPSSHVVSWVAAWRWLHAQNGVWPDTFLMNRTALGRTRGRFAVAVGPEIIELYRDSRLAEHTPLLTRHPEAIIHPDRVPALFAGFLDDPRSVFCPLDWPPHASGPLATWAAAAMGYGRIYLFGLDGTAGPPSAVEDFDRRARAWEMGIRRWRDARGDDQDARQQVIRLWPKGFGVAFDQDPLRTALAAALEVPT